jgi:hypothetical protein
MPRNSLYRNVYEQRQSAKTPNADTGGDNSHIEIETPHIVPPKGHVPSTPKNPSGYPVQPTGHETETA